MKIFFTVFGIFFVVNVIGQPAKAENQNVPMQKEFRAWRLPRVLHNGVAIDGGQMYKLVDVNSITRNPNDHQLAIAWVCTTGQQSSCENEPEMWLMNCSTGYIKMRNDFGWHDGYAFRQDQIFTEILQYVCAVSKP